MGRKELLPVVLAQSLIGAGTVWCAALLTADMFGASAAGYRRRHRGSLPLLHDSRDGAPGNQPVHAADAACCDPAAKGVLKRVDAGRPVRGDWRSAPTCSPGRRSRRLRFSPRFGFCQDNDRAPVCCARLCGPEIKCGIMRRSSKLRPRQSWSGSLCPKSCSCFDKTCR